MDTVRDIKNKISKELYDIYTVNEISSLCKRLFAHILNYSSTQYLLNDGHELSAQETLLFEDAIIRLKNSEPIDYIIENTEFFGLNFHVNKHVLIPRPETEELIVWIKETNNNPSKIVDICTGSGCIAIALKSIFGDAHIDGWDISEGALSVATKNSKTNHLPINFKRIDVLKHVPNSEDKFDIMVSNPPYVRESEKSLMQKNVLEHEPHLALFVDDHSPLVFYIKIAQIALEQLTPGGKLYFEINEAFAQKTMEMLKEKGFINIELRKDFNGRDRMVKAQRP